MNLPRSKLKNAFYILVALALVYVFLINASLNNTVKEALSPDFTKKTTFTTNGESGSNNPKDATHELLLYQINMTEYRSKLDDRLKDLKTNPSLVNDLKKYRVEAFLTEEGKVLNQLVSEDIPPNLRQFLTMKRFQELLNTFTGLNMHWVE